MWADEDGRLLLESGRGGGEGGADGLRGHMRQCGLRRLAAGYGWERVRGGGPSAQGRCTGHVGGRGRRSFVADCPIWAVSRRNRRCGLGCGHGRLEAAGAVRGGWGARGAPKRVVWSQRTWVALGGSVVGPWAGMRGSVGRLCADVKPDGRPGPWHICPPVACLGPISISQLPSRAPHAPRYRPWRR